jgi:tRNA (guanine-N7-)-methyltransferase
MDILAFVFDSPGEISGLGLAPPGPDSRKDRVDFKPEFLATIRERRMHLRGELATLFPVPRPIVWEIGSGHGHFLVHYAQEYPDKFCVGVDIVTDRLVRSRRKRDRARLPNCHFLRTEAREFLHVLPPGIIFEEIWVLFPDPWPKARHNKHRLLKPEFFEAVAGRAEPGAKFFFRTDHPDYFREVEGLLPAVKTWRIDPSAHWPLEKETVFQARAPTYRSLVAVRTSHPARPVELIAPGLPPPAEPTSPA